MDMRTTGAIAISSHLTETLTRIDVAEPGEEALGLWQTVKDIADGLSGHAQQEIAKHAVLTGPNKQGRRVPRTGLEAWETH